MTNWAGLLLILQIVFSVIIGIYFFHLLRNQQASRHTIDKEAKKELEKLKKMRNISLTEPLAEKTRPTSIDELVGQKEGIRALRAALCGPNPQHVIIYGPPGVGKTATARLILEEAKKNPHSPFNEHSQFVELDATTARFDERGIADPLIGSVHDPIYQGAGAMGMAGIPQPKPGAVTKAHGGVLFIDEIGELHPIQMNKLLKVLEDRKVFLESAYYSPEDQNTPAHIHDIFQNGLPADFRLIGATTRTPEEIPPAIRSRCMEIFFRPLTREEIRQIAVQAFERIPFAFEDEAISVIEKYATNGRDAVNLVQMAVGLALTEGKKVVEQQDVEWVVHSNHLSPRPEWKMPDSPQVGVVSGLAVYGPNLGMLLEIEVSASKADGKKGEIWITGVVEEEEIGGSQRTIRRKSMARSSVENVLTVLRKLGLKPDQYDLHINFPGGMPVDGPSAGIAIATAIYSAIMGLPVSNEIAMTGELSIHGRVKPVGGVIAKVEAARQAGAKKVLIPAENWQALFADMEGIHVVPVKEIEEVFGEVFQNASYLRQGDKETPPMFLLENKV